MILVSIGLLSLYVLMIVRLFIAWRQILALERGNTTEFVSVIIPVRNEALNISVTIASIFENDFPKDQFEIIVVDDHSTDDTVKVVEEWNFPNLIIERLQGEQTGKKAAITQGIKVAKGELIVCTDGDTVVSNRWLERHQNSYSNGMKLTFGPVEYLGQSFVVDLLNLELMSLVGVGGAMISLGQASMINGCNYSFSKKAFDEVGGFEGNDKLATGDDEFLLRKIHKQYRSEICFLKDQAAVVRTAPVRSFKEFFQQRKRWASKWKHHKDALSKIIPIVVFVFYLIFLSAILYLFDSNLLVALGLVLTKCTIDWVFIKSIGRGLGMKFKLLPFMVLQIIYPFYAVFFGLASNFGHYRWKDRHHHI